MHSRFGLTLIVNHACNLRCTYCYTGSKFHRRMPAAFGQKAIDRAFRSLSPEGALDLAFFGGEPLVEAELILDLVAYARLQAASHDAALGLNMTTNGTLDSVAAWSVMTLPEMRLAISHDGLPRVHDAHRIAVDGRPTSQRVLDVMGRLVDGGRDFRVVMVVRPQGVESMALGLEFLYARGVRNFDLSLDLWTTWTRRDGERLAAAIRRAAEFWGGCLPECSINWFDEKAARATGIPLSESARCGFGHAEIAVTPAGNLYPCERLVGADEPGNAMRLPGHVLDADDFLGFQPHVRQSAAECAPCVLQKLCSTSTCCCSNYVRTGDVDRPDGLLCLLDQTCCRETLRVLESRAVSSA
jgi:uncharacterized protein